MARGAKKAETRVADGLPRFVDIRLDQIQRADFVAQAVSADDLLAALAELIGDGLRVGFSWAEAQNAYICSLTGKGGSGDNFGLCMTSFAASPAIALALAFYKHSVVCGGRWVAAEEEDLGTFG